MSNNLRDLYRKKGKKLASDQKKSKESAQSQLKSYLESKLGKPINSEMKRKILQLEASIKISGFQSRPTSSNESLQKNQDLDILILSFGLNYQRLYGHGLKDPGHFLKIFVQTHPKHYKMTLDRLHQSLEYLNKQKLLYFYDPTKETLFESPEAAGDFYLIFQLVRPDGSLFKNVIQRELSWTTEKVKSRLKALEDSGLMVVDNETLWFPQLAENK